MIVRRKNIFESLCWHAHRRTLCVDLKDSRTERNISSRILGQHLQSFLTSVRQTFLHLANVRSQIHKRPLNFMLISLFYIYSSTSYNVDNVVRNHQTQPRTTLPRTTLTRTVLIKFVVRGSWICTTLPRTPLILTLLKKFVVQSMLRTMLINVV